jgi:hypothetical protein
VERMRALGIPAIGRATLGNATEAIEAGAATENADVVVVATQTGALGQVLRSGTGPTASTHTPGAVGSIGCVRGQP